MTYAEGAGLSVIIIGRDEEKHLPESLPPLLLAADEVIFVDTGSLDRTPEIVQDLGCQFFQMDWEDNFSKPKNFALDQARQAWVLNADCDEILQDPHAARTWIDDHCLSSPAPAFIVHIDNLLLDGSSTPSQAIRLFRNDSRIRYQNPVHEDVSTSIYQHWPTIPLTASTVRLQHLGYQEGHNKQKIRRNINILKKWIEKEPQNMFCCYKLGINLNYIGSSIEGLHYLERAFSLMDQSAHKGTYPFLGTLVATYHEALLTQGETAKASEVQNKVQNWQR